MYKILTVQRNQRVAYLRDGELVRVYGPGRWTLWTWGAVVELLTWDTTVVAPIARGDPLPDVLEGAAVVAVAPWERVVVRVEGKVQQVLTPGRYRLWDPGEVELLRVDLRERPAALADDDRLVPNGGWWVEVTASNATAQVLYRDGAPVEVLAPGRYRLWNDGPWRAAALPLSLQVLEVAAQDIVTADQVPVRVKPTATWRVDDPLLRATETLGEAQAYGAVQLALREVVAARELDRLVTDRDALSAELLERARTYLPPVGLRLVQVYVKDIILPGEIRDLVNKVTLARKEAEALSIKRREEVAATRQLANTAKLLQDNPVLLRLKELETLTELAGAIDKLIVVGGADMMKPWLLRDLAE